VPSFADLVEQVIGLLNDYTGQTPQMCSLALPLTGTDLVMTVDDGLALGRGMVEVDEELVFVSAFDQSGATATIPAWGRAQQGTTAAAHSAGARVTTTPRPPRDRVKKQINAEISALYPQLYAVLVDEQDAVNRAEYALPARTRFVLDIQALTTGLPIEWERARAWRLNTSADPGDFPTGVSVAIPEVPTGSTIRTVVAAEPLPLANPSDDFETTTGLHAGAADVVALGAAAQLSIGQEVARAQLATVEQSQRVERVQTGSSLAASRFLRQEYLRRLAAEKTRLLARYPSRPHYEGV
jgi:hypothetical protein